MSKTKLSDFLISWDAGAWGEQATDLDTGVSVLRSTNILESGELSFRNQALLEIPDKTYEKKRLVESDILLERSGGGPKQPVGRVAIFRGGTGRFICGNFISCLKVNTKLADPEYLLLRLLSLHWSGHTEKFQSATTGIRNLQLKDYLNQEFYVPNISKQRNIARSLKSKLAEVEKIRKSILLQNSDRLAFVKRIHEKSQLSLENEEQIPLGDLLVNIEAGKSFKTTELQAMPDQLGVLKVSAVSWNNFIPQEAKLLEDGYEPDERHRVKKGDLIISRANTLELVGAVVRVNENYPNRLLSDKTLRLLVNENEVLPDYLLQVLRWPAARSYIESNATGTSDSMRNISQKTIRRIPVPKINIQKQKSIIEMYKKVSDQISRIDSAIKVTLNDSKLIPKKLLEQAFEM